MKNLFKNVYEHLKTRKKYNTLRLLYDAKCEELEDKILEINELRKLNKTIKEKYSQEIDDQIKETIKLREKLKGNKKGAK